MSNIAPRRITRCFVPSKDSRFWAGTLRIGASLLLAILISGCHKRSSSQPAAPLINPSDYSVDDYKADLAIYKQASAPGPNFDPELAKQKRNDIVYGLMAQIEVVYGDYYRRLFSGENATAIAGDAMTLGLTSASTIATHAATKTIFSALGTAFSGLSLSVNKNLFAQQAFPVIGVAMQTRRDKIRATIVSNLGSDTTAYPLLAAKRDLVAYLNAGTLSSGLQELQEEAGSATAASTTAAAGSKPPIPAGVTAAAGNAQVSLAWTASTGATSYNLYHSTTTGVTPANGTKIAGISSNSYTHSGLTNGTTYYYVVTAVNANGESAPSTQVSATPAVPAGPGAGVPQAPTNLNARAGNSQVSLLWTASAGATSYNIYFSKTAGLTVANGTRIAGITTNSYVHSGLTNGTVYHYIVTAVNANGESPASSEASATPAPAHPEPLIMLTPH